MWPSSGGKKFSTTVWKKGFQQLVSVSACVFVQRLWVCCHCGPHSTVVQSRVCHCSRGDLQIHLGFIFTHFKRQSRYWIFNHFSVFHVRDEELRWFSWILSIPEEIISSSFRICTGQSNSAAF